MKKIKETIPDLDEKTGVWHPSFTEGYTKVTGTITGCGLMQMYSVTNLDKKAVNNIKIKAKKIGAGAIICTLGKCYWESSEKKLLELGFEMISEYHNYVHGDEYMQRIYILKT